MDQLWTGEERISWLFNLLKKLYNNLREFVYDLCQEDTLMDVKTDESLKLLPRNLDMLIGRL